MLTDDNNINSILLKALRIEQSGQNLFSNIAKLAKDKASINVFNRLAAEEENHFYLLKEALRQNGGKIDDEIEFSSNNFFNNDIKKILYAGPITAFRYAIEVEQKVIDYYNSSLRFIKDQRTRQMFRDLIDFEESHKKILNKNLSRLLDKRSLNVKPM